MKDTISIGDAGFLGGPLLDTTLDRGVPCTLSAFVGVERRL